MGDYHEEIGTDFSEWPTDKREGRMAEEDQKQLAERDKRIAELEQDNARLRCARRNQLGDDLCWIVSEGEAKALPEAEFLESCRRYRNQIAGERGVVVGCMTIAQLEARVEHLIGIAENQAHQRELAASRVKELEAELKKERETWFDGETTWTRPTAWAYAQACNALREKEARVKELEGTVEILHRNRMDYEELRKRFNALSHRKDIVESLLAALIGAMEPLEKWVAAHERGSANWIPDSVPLRGNLEFIAARGDLTMRNLRSFAAAVEKAREGKPL